MKRTLFLLCLIILATLTLAKSDKDSKSEEAHKLSSFSSFTQSFTSTFISEFGDNTFWLAAIMSMRYDRLAVLAGTLLAVLATTIISTVFGSVMTMILSPKITHVLVTILFFYFGGKLIYKAVTDKSEEEDEETEAEEKVDKLHTKLTKKDGPSTNKKSGKGGISSKLIFIQAFSMTFFGEWGDRSQITTIALATEGSALLVSLGAFLGNASCTGLGVAGGKFLAKKVSEKTVTIIAGVLFLIFGIHNLFD